MALAKHLPCRWLKQAQTLCSFRCIKQNTIDSFFLNNPHIYNVQRDTSNDDTASRIRSLGRQAWIVSCDLSSSEDCRSVVRRITSTADDGLGLTIDILVNCGGVQKRLVTELNPSLPLFSYSFVLFTHLRMKITDIQHMYSRMMTGMRYAQVAFASLMPNV